MKFSKYISKAVTPVMALFQKQHGCLSNKATTICGYSVCSLRQVPVRHNRGGKSTENKVRFAPPTMCRLTFYCIEKIKRNPPFSNCKAFSQSPSRSLLPQRDRLTQSDGADNQYLTSIIGKFQADGDVMDEKIIS